MLRKGEENIEIIFVTGNKHKFMEASLIAKEFGIRLIQKSYKKIEIQANSLEEIAIRASRSLRRILRNRAYIVEDAGLFIELLKGFPGPYSSYVFKTIGCNGIIKLLKDYPKPWRALFKSVVVLYHPEIGEKMFIGETEGFISDRIRGSRGFGFDPIFIPKEIGDRTYAEMDVNEKNAVSHRGKAMRKTFSFIAEFIKL